MNMWLCLFNMRPLYKYLNVNSALSMMRGRNLQFTNPLYFNDPFDSHPDLFDLGVPDGYKLGWAPKSFIKNKAKCDSENNRQRVWISCLSKRNDSMLMWSYYTNHRGVCIGLNEDALKDDLCHLGFCLLYEDVKYRNIREKPNGIRNVDLFYQFFTKGEEWQHEQEVRFAIIDPHPSIPYRVMRSTKRTEIIPWTEVRFYPRLSSNCFHSIYLGARMTDADKLNILRCVKAFLPDVKVFQMIADNTTFSFVEEPVDVDKYLSEHPVTFKLNIKTKLHKLMKM